MRTWTAILTCGALAACQPAGPQDDAAAPEQAAAASVEFSCAEGGTVITRSAQGGPLELTRDGQTYVLRPAEAVRGARWTGETLEWWVLVQGGLEQATLRRLGPEGVGDQVLARCQRSTGATAAVAAPPGDPESVPACRSAALSLELVSQDAGAGSRGATFALNNTGVAPCRMQGVPRLELVGDAGVDALRVEPAPGRTADPVVIPVGGRAWFDVLSSALPHGEAAAPCPQVTGVRAGARGDAGWAESDYAVQPCGGVVRVTPVRGEVESPA